MDFEGYIYKDSIFFWLILFIVIALGIYLFRLRRKDATLIFSGTGPFEEAGKPIRSVREILFPALRIFALLLLVVALARPQTMLEKEKITTEGIDIVLALDVSSSMLARDFKPDRLEAARNLGLDFISGRPNDRVGLVIFAGESFTQSPLTTDHKVLENIFSEVESGMLKDGTAIGMGLATAVDRLKSSSSISKVIILLTDGVNNTGFIDPRTAAEIAKEFNIRVYTIGIGSKGTAPYPVQTPFGVRMQEVKVEIDEELLAEIAQMTGGEYFRATGNEKLEDVYREIDRLEKTKIEVASFKRYTEKFYPFALLAALLLLAEFILGYTFLRKYP